MAEIKKGLFQVYTGDGKGKTTAALGLALRAVGAGMKVFFGQFVKGMEYGELTSIAQYFPGIVIKQYGRDCFIQNQPEAEDVALAKAGLEEIKKVLMSGEFQLVVLDEASIATYFDLFSVDDLISVVSHRVPDVEVVVTGRKADARLIEIADLVTEMVEVKHYYLKGIEARKGIEF